MNKDRLYHIASSPYGVLCGGRLVCTYNTQSCTGGSLVLLVGLTTPGRSAGEGSHKTALWMSRLEVRRRANNPVL